MSCSGVQMQVPSAVLFSYPARGTDWSDSVAAGGSWEVAQPYRRCRSDRRPGAVGSVGDVAAMAVIDVRWSDD